MNKSIAKAYLMTKLPDDEMDTWGNWQARILAQRYLRITQDLSGIEAKSILCAQKAMDAVDKCEFVDEPPSQQQWLAEYTDFVNSEPEKGTIITSYTGEPILINCSMPAGAMPFFSAKIYVPKMSCSPVDWFGHGISDRADFGWRAVLVPFAREEVIRRKIIQPNLTASVRALKILGISNSGKSVLVCVALW